MAELVWVMVEGQVGKVLRGQLRDAAGAVDLDALAPVNVRVAKSKTSALLVNQTVTADADQTTETFVDGESVSGKGWLSFTTEATAAALRAGTYPYLLNFKGSNAGVDVYFPLSRHSVRTYGRLVVQEPLG